MGKSNLNFLLENVENVEDVVLIITRASIQELFKEVKLLDEESNPYKSVSHFVAEDESRKEQEDPFLSHFYIFKNEGKNSQLIATPLLLTQDIWSGILSDQITSSRRRKLKRTLLQKCSKRFGTKKNILFC